MAAEVLGSRLLREVECEEGSLEDILTQLRTLVPSTNPLTTLPPALTHILTHRPSHPHSPKTITLSGSYIPLINNLILNLLSSTRPTTICILDLTRRFSVSHLVQNLEKENGTGRMGLGIEELKHIHIFHPTVHNLETTLRSLEGYMVYGDHRSKGREWRGVFVIGGSPTIPHSNTNNPNTNSTSHPATSAAAYSGVGTTIRNANDEKLLLGTSWRGWLKVEREDLPTFGAGISVEEAWEESTQREQNQRGCGEKEKERGWRAFCGEGVYRF